MIDWQFFRQLDYERFRQMAGDPKLSANEKAGFPDAYRSGRESAIFQDIAAKLDLAARRGLTVVEIGPGCSALPRLLIDLCGERSHRLALIDSAEVLDQIAVPAQVERLHGRFPEIDGLGERFDGRVDAVLAYSVLQYVVQDGLLEAFVDRALALLAPGGRMLLGDLPNADMRARFVAGTEGEAFRGEHATRDAGPAIDDALVLGLLARMRGAGAHAWVVPQAPALPMANRREDILVVLP